MSKKKMTKLRLHKTLDNYAVPLPRNDTATTSASAASASSGANADAASSSSVADFLASHNVRVLNASPQQEATDLDPYLNFSCDWVKFRICCLYFPHVVPGITNYTIGMITYRVCNVTCKI